MKNKLSISLLVVTLSCAFVAFAESTKIEEENVNMELSENELKTIIAECTEIAVENELTGDDLTAYVDECFADNTMVVDDAEEAPVEGEEAPVEGEEAPVEGEEAPVEGEESSTENTS